ncbi:MAG: N-formylglutamate amidohydrolase [Actinomycetota bacterium]|nr:N-formylglutamate amidohydrolase [Actinomycetota bacterium]MDA2995556.1 N-formylglutamate amidohydrolase [Actinomycetota bacterium]
MAESGTLADPVVIHVPHSSTYIPKDFLDQFISTSDRLEVIHEALVDHDTDTMAASLGRVIAFPYSRLLVDVERFIDDSVEEMAEFGMGAFYSVDHELQQMRREITAQERNALFKLYVAHHQRLEEAVDAALESFNHCLLIDLHSYSAARLLPIEIGSKKS